MIPDVLAEHAQAIALRPSDRQAFRADGVPDRALVWTACGELSIVALDRVVFAGQRFEYARYLRDTEGAVNAYVAPLLDTCGRFADVLAFRPGGPAGTWLGQPIAGAENILAPRPDLGDALDVYDVLSWLRAGREGIVILDPARAAWPLQGITLRVADHVAARRLRTALTRVPQVVVAPHQPPAVVAPRVAV